MMKCLNCGKDFINKRDLKNLFSNDILCVCDKCYLNYKIKPSISIIPISNGSITILSLFSSNNRPFSYKAFSQEFVKIYKHLASKNNIIIPYETLKLSENIIKELEMIYGLTKQKIILLTYVDES